MTVGGVNDVNHNIVTVVFRVRGNKGIRPLALTPSFLPVDRAFVRYHENHRASALDRRRYDVSLVDDAIRVPERVRGVCPISFSGFQPATATCRPVRKRADYMSPHTIRQVVAPVFNSQTAVECKNVRRKLCGLLFNVFARAVLSPDIARVRELVVHSLIGAGRK